MKGFTSHFEKSTLEKVKFMRRRKRIKIAIFAGFALLICAVITISLILKTQRKGFVFAREEDYYVIEGYEGNDSLVEIPSVYRGRNVKVIKSEAFAGSSMQEVIIPNSIESIGDFAFFGCISLKSVEIGDGVTQIGFYVFDGCSSLTSIEIGDGVTQIWGSAFSGFTSLTSVVIGDSVTTIGNYAFKDCTSLTSVVIGDSVTTIGERAFYNCTSLTSIKYRGTEEQWQAISKGSYWDECYNYNNGYYQINYIITYNYQGK